MKNSHTNFPKLNSEDVTLPRKMSATQRNANRNHHGDYKLDLNSQIQEQVEVRLQMVGLFARIPAMRRVVVMGTRRCCVATNFNQWKWTSSPTVNHSRQNSLYNAQTGVSHSHKPALLRASFSLRKCSWPGLRVAITVS